MSKKILQHSLKLPFSPSRRKGNYYEDIALEYLRKRGARAICRNFNCRHGEIDLILEHKKMLVFVEVRYRKRGDYGQAFETVNFYKQQKIIKTAKVYLLKHDLTEKVACRFDVIGVSGENSGTQCHWIQNAF